MTQQQINVSKIIRRYRFRIIYKRLQGQKTPNCAKTEQAELRLKRFNLLELVRIPSTKLEFIVVNSCSTWYV